MMEHTSLRNAGLAICLAVLISFFLYSAAEIPKRYPSTRKILKNPGLYEGKRLKIRGRFEGYELKDENIVLELERYGKSFQVRVPRSEIREICQWSPRDVIDLVGCVRLSTENYIVSEEIDRRPQERHHRMFLLSLAGLAVVLGGLAIDRKQLLRVIPWPTG